MFRTQRQASAPSKLKLRVGSSWSGYPGFALEFKFVSTSDGPSDGRIEVANFTGTKGWKFTQTKSPWPELGVGDESYVYIDFASCMINNNLPNPQAMTAADRNKVCGAGWQVITHDPDMLGKTITLIVTPSTVPEPSTWLMLGAGSLLGLLLWRRRR